jgi:hypothetical protein
MRYLLGLGVSVGVGLAPYLGKLHIPLFSPLLDLIPESLQSTILPLSSALMGIVAVGVQWYGGGHLTERWLRRAFTAMFLLTIVLFVILAIVHKRVVAVVPYSGGAHFKSFTVGFQRPNKPPCDNLAPAACISDHLTFNPIRIETYFGADPIFYGETALELSYLMFMGSFSTLVGILLLRDERSKRIDKA